MSFNSILQILEIAPGGDVERPYIERVKSEDVAMVAAAATGAGSSVAVSPPAVAAIDRGRLVLAEPCGIAGDVPGDPVDPGSVVGIYVDAGQGEAPGSLRGGAPFERWRDIVALAGVVGRDDAAVLEYGTRQGELLRLSFSTAGFEFCRIQRHGGRSATEQVGEKSDGVGQLGTPIVVDIRDVVADRRVSPGEEVEEQGDRIAYVNPDCGFGWSPRYMSIPKLDALVNATAKIRNEIST